MSNSGGVSSVGKEVDFGKPPIVEVAMSIQFEPLKTFHIGMLGVVWDAFRKEYPDCRFNGRVDYIIEKFGVSPQPKRAGFKFLDKPEIPRMMLSTEDGQYLIQVQEDRFILNWRKVSADCTYPRHELIKNRLFDAFEKFKVTILGLGEGKPIPNQFEITNVNLIRSNGDNITDLFEDVLTNQYFNRQEEGVEGLSVSLRHVLKDGGEPVGRLYTTIDSDSAPEIDEGVVTLKFTARMHPTASEPKNDFLFLRNKINESFVSVTSSQLQREWDINND